MARLCKKESTLNEKDSLADMLNAEKMLLEQRTIEETAAACGFASAQYFCRFFPAIRRPAIRRSNRKSSIFFPK